MFPAFAWILVFLSLTSFSSASRFARNSSHSFSAWSILSLTLSSMACNLLAVSSRRSFFRFSPSATISIHFCMALSRSAFSWISCWSCFSSNSANAPVIADRSRNCCAACTGSLVFNFWSFFSLATIMSARSLHPICFKPSICTSSSFASSTAS